LRHSLTRGKVIQIESFFEMLEMEPKNDELQAAISGEILFVRIQGRGSFKIAAPMKQFIAEITHKKSITLVAIDLKNCIGMDSTFMGVLAGLSGRLKSENVSLELINLSEKNQKLLTTLGVDKVLSFYKNDNGLEASEQKTESLPTDTASKKEMAETALTAHQNLVKISDENQPRFKRVIEFLKEDVDRLN
jgi:anti-sigma B factor antagonist